MSRCWTALILCCSDSLSEWHTVGSIERKRYLSCYVRQLSSIAHVMLTAFSGIVGKMQLRCDESAIQYQSANQSFLQFELSLVSCCMSTFVYALYTIVLSFSVFFLCCWRF